MWLALAFTSAVLLGLYDVAKKSALRGNAVVIVLLGTVLCSSLIFAPLIISANMGWWTGSASAEALRSFTLEAHLLVMLKAVIVLGAWLLGYIGIKYLPITLVGPINASRPIFVLLGAALFLGERLNLYQWLGVSCALFSIYLLSLSGKREGINFRSNPWILATLGAAVLGATSGLYDKFLLTRLDPLFVQAWYSLYQLVIMLPLTYLLWWRKPERTPIRWTWALVLIPLLLSLADYAYFLALSESESLISVVSMIRRGSVLVSFGYGAFVLGEGNLKGKALDLLLIFVGLILLYIGSQ